MSNNEIGPWGSRTPEPPPRRGFGRGRKRLDLGRLGLWLCLLAALAGLIVALAHAFPESVRTHEDWSWVAYRAGFAVLIAAALFRAGRLRRAHLRYAAMWAGVIAVAALGYAYREELAGVPRHLRIAFSGGDPVLIADHELVVPQDPQGGFVVIGRVNGQRVRFLVDTGASDTVLSPDDARRLGVDIDHLGYVKVAETANGLGYGAPFAAASLEVGPIALRGFNMTVNQAPMSASLLGMSFLNRLESFQVVDHKLVLRWRDGA
jgi:aspartyl protease family protein